MSEITADLILYTGDKPGKKGFPVKIRITKNRKSLYDSLKLYSSAEDWDFEKQLPKKSHPNFRSLTTKVKNRKLQLLDELEFANSRNLSLVNAREIIRKGLTDEHQTAAEIAKLKSRLAALESKQSIDVLQFFDKRIKELKIAGKSIAAYENTRREVNNYLAGYSLQINEISYSWVKEFSTYKLESGCGVNGLIYYLKTLRALFNEAKKRDLGIPKDVNPFEGNIPSPAPKGEKDNISAADIRKVIAYTPKPETSFRNREKMKRNIDLWILQLMLGGQDYADIATLKWDHLKDWKLRKQRYKNRSKPEGGPVINIPVLPEALHIIQKHSQFGTDRVFPFIPDPQENESRYNRFRKNIGRSLATISTDLKIDKTLKTKSPRYTFRTIAGELGIPQLIIEQIQGHSSRDISLKYQDILPTELIESNLKRVIDHILNKDEQK